MRLPMSSPASGRRVQASPPVAPRSRPSGAPDVARTAHHRYPDAPHRGRPGPDHDHPHRGTPGCTSGRLRGRSPRSGRKPEEAYDTVGKSNRNGDFRQRRGGIIWRSSWCRPTTFRRGHDDTVPPPASAEDVRRGGGSLVRTFRSSFT
jgi:hypothetical protein